MRRNDAAERTMERFMELLVKTMREAVEMGNEETIKDFENCVRSLGVPEETAGEIATCAKERFFRRKRNACEAAFLIDSMTGLPGQYLYNLIFNPRKPARRKSDLFVVREFVSYVREAYPQNELCVAFVDFAGFKKVNDELGHEFGDFVLSEFGKRIKESGLLAFRRGGDEFLLIGDCKEMEKTEKIFEKKSPFVRKNGGRNVDAIPIFGIHRLPEGTMVPPSNFEELGHFRNIMGFHVMVAETACYDNKRKRREKR